MYVSNIRYGIGKILAGLALLPLAGRFVVPSNAIPPVRESSRVVIMQEPIEGVVERPDVRLHYRVFGKNGPYVVILAGGPGGSNRMMQPIAAHLKDRFRCVMLEQRGTDRSKLAEYSPKTLSFDAYLSDIEELRKHLGQEKIILIGNSWGMTLAFAYAGAYPKQVKAIATLGSGGLTVEQFKTFGDNRRVRISADQEGRIADLHRRGLGAEEMVTEIFKIVIPSYFFQPEAAARAVAAIQIGDINHRLDEHTGAILARTDEMVYARLPRLHAPVLVVQGRQDLAPEEVAFTIRDRVRGSKIVLLSECGHVPWLDQPETTWKTLDEFMAPFAADRMPTATFKP